MKSQRYRRLLSLIPAASILLSGFAPSVHAGSRRLIPAGAPTNGRIAFVSERDGNQEIYTTNPDGSNLMRLTFHAEADRQPVWSPDGTRIAFTRVNLEGGFPSGSIFVMNADGSDQRRLTPSGEFHNSPNWSPDGTRIVFERVFTPYHRQIFVMNADGSEQRHLTPSGESNYSPTWSPVGTKIAFVRNRFITGFAPQLGIMNADGSDQRIISDTVIATEWSPDGSKFAGSDLSSLGIFVINVDGSGRTQITSHPFTGFNVTWDTDPSWSPDGSKIVFYRFLGCDSELTACRSSQIWVVNADGSNARNLTDESTGVFDYDPAWSPDGTKIVFERRGDLFVMNADGGGITNITGTENKVESSPSWQALSLNQPPSPDPIDDPQFFVRQHYLDFLGREPDQGGWDYWSSDITQCGNDTMCVHNRRIDISAAFFIELEFQETGYVVYRLHRAAFGTLPAGPTRVNLSFTQFMTDRGQLVAGPGLPQSTIDFANAFVQRPEFLAAFHAEDTNEQFVNTLFDTAGLTPFAAERQQQVEAMNNTARTRAQVLLEVIEFPAFKTGEYNDAFVLMQYFGYLRRDPDQAGYDFWLSVLDNQQLNNYRGMVCAFLTSSEYQQRFGTTVPRTDRDCVQ